MLILEDYTGSEKWFHQYICDWLGVDSWGSIGEHDIRIELDHDLKTVSIQGETGTYTPLNDGYGYAYSIGQTGILTRSPDSFNNLYKKDFDDSGGQYTGTFVSHQNFNRAQFADIPTPDYETIFNELKIWGTTPNNRENYHDNIIDGIRIREYYKYLNYLQLAEMDTDAGEQPIIQEGWFLHFQSPLYKTAYEGVGYDHGYYPYVWVEIGGSPGVQGYFWKTTIAISILQYGNHASETVTDPPPPTTYQTYLMETDDNGILLDDIPQTAGANGLRFLNGKNYVI